METSRLAWIAAVVALASPAMGATRLDRIPRAARDTVRVYLIRHGEAGLNLGAQPQVAEEDLDRLTPNGIQQARRLAAALAGRPIDLVLSSPAERARDTAATIARTFGLTPVVDARLRPLEFGRQGRAHDAEWKRRAREWSRRRDPVDPGAESLADGARRVQEVLDGVRSRPGPREVVVVAHNEVIAPYAAIARGKPAWADMPRGVSNGSVTVVDLPAEGRPVVRARDLRP